jgi:VWFA-related protein
VKQANRSYRLAAVAAFVSLAGAVAAGARAAPPSGRAAQEPSPAFRAAVDVIPVDVQVVESDGRPVTDLGLDDFEVTINGRKRRIVSVNLIDYRTTPAAAGSTPAAAPAAASGSLSSPSELTPQPRVFILAVDASSFDEATARPVINAAARFIDRLSPSDEVGLFTFPLGPKVDPTTDHAAVARALDDIVARRETAWSGEFTLFPSDLVELSMWTGGLPTSAQAEALLLTICPPDDPEFPNEPGGECLQRLEPAVRSAVMVHEGLAQTTIGTLRALMAGLATVPIRKTVVLVSGGLVTADQPGARPDGMGLGLEVGKTAAEANVSVYTLFIDHSARQANAAESRRPRNSQINVSRDRDIYGRWLDQFSGAAGGVMIPVAFGDGTPAFDRILSETSAYYLLGVEPEPQDRDGRARELNVKVSGGRVSVRGRSWVVVPKEGTPLPGSEVAGIGPRNTPVVAAAPPVVGVPVSPALRALADAFERDDHPALLRALAGADGVTLVRAIRASESPWPESPQRTAAFVLDVTLIGLRTSSHFTREESLRLLAEYTIRVRQEAVNDPFECAWLRVESAGLAGLHSPQVTTGFIERAVARCPDDPRLRLTAAVVFDQLVEQSARTGAPPSGRAVTDGERRLLDAYAAVAAAAPAVRPEARIRSAWVHYRAGRAADGLALLGDLASVADDPQLRYFHAVVRGQLLRAAGQADAAADAFREGLAAWPGAQTARVGLMTLHVQRGEAAEAAALAEQIQAASPEMQDPWWLFRLGDYRAYPALRAHLREMTP